MSLFRHPHLVRGIVHTHQGQFFINRGLVEMPDDVGESLGWLRVDPDEDTPAPRVEARPGEAGAQREPSFEG